MKKLLIGIFALAAVAGISSCSKSDNNNSNPTTTAKAMFVNGSASSDPIDGKVNGASVSNATNLAYLKNSSYTNVNAGNDTISFVYTNAQILFNSTTSTLVAGKYYSVFAGGVLNPTTILVTEDDLSAPASGKAKIRVVNLSSDTTHINVAMGLATLFSNIAPNQASTFTEITAASSTLVMGDPNNSSAVIALNNQSFAAGKIYTIIYTGTVRGSSQVALKATVIANN